MDMMNYRVQRRQPQLQEHSIRRARAQFQERLRRKPGVCVTGDGAAGWEPGLIAGCESVLCLLLGTKFLLRWGGRRVGVQDRKAAHPFGVSYWPGHCLGKSRSLKPALRPAQVSWTTPPSG